jgi:tRNA(Glu) U13 pseudouridine synthase TruD
MTNVALHLQRVKEAVEGYRKFVETSELNRSGPKFLNQVDYYRRKITEEIAKVKAISSGPIIEVKVFLKNGQTGKIYYSNIQPADIEEMMFWVDKKAFQIDTFIISQVFQARKLYLD